MTRILAFDEWLLHALVACRRIWLDRTMRTITHLGGATSAITAALLLCLTPPRGLQQAGAVAAFALATSHLAVQLLKRSVTRARPALRPGFEMLIHAPDRFSFPSGHAAAAFAVALPVAAALPVMAAAALIALALTIGISRCYLGVHYPGDVLAGWLLAAVALAAAPAGLALLGLA
ncbi:MAG: phosphatase PAP2 family protein [Longimicrobiales bacterium]